MCAHVCADSSQRIYSSLLLEEGVAGRQYDCMHMSLGVALAWLGVQYMADEVFGAGSLPPPPLPPSVLLPQPIL